MNVATEGTQGRTAPPAVRIGTSGFSFSDWVGTVYPADMDAASMLAYYERTLGFDCLEVNFTYYTLPAEKTIAGMERKTSREFRFVVKAFRGMTHDPFDTRLKARPGLAQVEKDFRMFVSALRPFHQSGKLACILLQYPVFFLPGKESREFILRSADWLAGLPAVVEFRNRAWAKEETFAFLKEHRLGYCAVDEPQLPRLMPFVGRVTSEIAYVRLHGRNPNWFNVPAQERYNYLYSQQELESLVPGFEKMAASAGVTYLFFNNCHGGNAARNAQTVKSILRFRGGQ